MAWYDATFVQTGRSPALWALVGFLVTFALVRTITRRIHARQAARAEDSGPIKDVFIGGVHVHHQVWGILLVLVSGLLTFRFRPESPWIDVLALVFGAGAALTLDEFALWFHLDDVYWSTEGRKSIDAILVGAALGGAILLGVSPIGSTNSTNAARVALLDPRRHAPGVRAGLRPQGQARDGDPGCRRARRSPGSAPRDWRSRAPTGLVAGTAGRSSNGRDVGSARRTRPGATASATCSVGPRPKVPKGPRPSTGKIDRSPARPGSRAPCSSATP